MRILLANIAMWSNCKHLSFWIVVGITVWVLLVCFFSRVSFFICNKQKTDEKMNSKIIYYSCSYSEAWGMHLLFFLCVIADFARWVGDHGKIVEKDTKRFEMEIGFALEMFQKYVMQVSRSLRQKFKDSEFSQALKQL